MSDLESVDALIAAAEKSRRPRRGADDEPAIPAEPPPAAPAAPDLPDPVGDAIAAAVAAALQGIDPDPEPQHENDPHETLDLPMPATDIPGQVEMEPSIGLDAMIEDTGELESSASHAGGRFDIVDGLIGRIEAAAKFVGSNPGHGYDREPTTQLLKEAAKALRRVREKRDENQKQMERWFLQWRASEAKSVEMLTELKRLTALQEQQTGLLVMARRYAVQGDVCVEWRDQNSWVIVLDERILNLSKQWEPDLPGSTDPDYLARTRFTLSDAVAQARGLRAMSNS